MRATTIIFAAIGGLISQAALADIVRHPSLPAEFAGKWATSADDCGKADNSAIVLSAKSYSEGTNVCTVEWVDELPGTNVPIYAAHLKCTTSRNQSPNIVLRRKDANQISAGATLDTLKSLQRCPAK